MASTTDRRAAIHLVPPAPDGAAVEAAPMALPLLLPLRRVVVPVDGSPFAERALPVACWLAGDLGAPLHLVEVVDDGGDTDHAIHYLADLARRHNATSWHVARDQRPREAIAAALGAEPPSLACLATHGRDRSASTLGSVAMQVLDDATEPVLLVGPRARPPCADDAPVVVAIDGTPGDRRVVRVAAEWAARLRRRLVVVTVTEPSPAGFRQHRPVRRSRGPVDPETCVSLLAAEAMAEGTGLGPGQVDARVVHDPVSVRDAIVDHVGRTTALLVIGTHRRTRPLHGVLGRHVSRIVHDIEVPALIVPLDAGG